MLSKTDVDAARAALLPLPIHETETVAPFVAAVDSYRAATDRFQRDSATDDDRKSWEAAMGHVVNTASHLRDSLTILAGSQ